METSNQIKTLLALAEVLIYKVPVTPPLSLNSVHGVISNIDLMKYTDTEMLENLSDLPTKHIILSFSKTILPQSAKAGYLESRVHPYIAHPRRRFKCQHFSHSSQTCRSKPMCLMWADAEHASDQCCKEVRCANCNESHPSYSKSYLCW